VSYLAIARKYRPATFDDIVGQEHVTRTLENAIKGGRIHHAYLFCGARGVGKTTAARALAKALNCELGPTPTPCGTCTTCLAITSGTSPDLIEIDGASNNSVDDIRDLRDTVHYAPTMGRNKIYLIDEVHMLSKAAFNALLKTLEEPPPHVIFLFATTEPEKILDTILSRVQRFDFKRISVPDVVARLQRIAVAEGATVSATALARIAQAGEGSMRDAQSLLDKVISASGGTATDDEVAQILGLVDRALLYRMVSGMVRGDAAACLDVIAQVYNFGHELSRFTADLLEALRNATFLRLAPGVHKHVDLPEAEIAALAEAVDGVDPEHLTRLFTALMDVHDQVSRAQRPRIVLEMGVARLASQRPTVPVATLLTRLDHLERRLRHGGARPSGSGGGSTGPRAASPRSEDGPRGPRRSRTPAVPSPVAPDRDSGPRASAAPLAAPVQQHEAAVEPEPTKAVPAPAPAPATNREPPDAWTGLRAALLAKDWSRVVADAEAVLEGDRLTLRLPAGRPLAEARRAIARPTFAASVAEHYPPGTMVELMALAHTLSADEAGRELRRSTLNDPAVRRIMETLGARLDKVEPLDPTQPRRRDDDV
jgi:DNA polymerase-3 subunit gamma/tau